MCDTKHARLPTQHYRHQDPQPDQAGPPRFGDPDRCGEAGIPGDLTFKTRPQQAEAMIQRALDAGVPFAGFTADE